LRFCLPFRVWLRWACMPMALCAVNAMAASDIKHTQAPTWLTAVDGFFYGVLSLAFIVNILIWITTRLGIHGLFAGSIIFSMLSGLSSDYYFHRLDLGIWSEQKGTLELWLFVGMTTSAILFALRILYVRFIVSRGTSLFAILRNIYTVRSLQNNLFALAFLFFVAYQWYGICILLGWLTETAINQSLWKLGLITSLTLLQVELIITHFTMHSGNRNKQTIKNTLIPQTDTNQNQSQELERLHEQLTHDFKTPLAIIDSSVQSLAMLDHEEDQQRALRYNRIRRAVTRINDLVMHSIITEKTNLNSRAEGTRALINLPRLLEAVLRKSVSGDFNCDRDCSLIADKEGSAGQRRILIKWQELSRPEFIFIDSDVDLAYAALKEVWDSSIQFSLPDTEIAIDIKKVEAPDLISSIEILIRILCDRSFHTSDVPKLLEQFYHDEVISDKSKEASQQFFAGRALEKQIGGLSVYMHKPGTIHFKIQLPIDKFTDKT